MLLNCADICGEGISMIFRKPILMMRNGVMIYCNVVDLQDIPTGADSCITSLACDHIGKSLIVAGCGDGSVRLYDRRLPPADRYTHMFCSESVVFNNNNDDV